MANYVNLIQSHIKRLKGTLEQVKGTRQREILDIEDELALSLSLEADVAKGNVPTEKLDLLLKVVQEAK